MISQLFRILFFSRDGDLLVVGRAGDSVECGAGFCNVPLLHPFRILSPVIF